MNEEYCEWLRTENKCLATFELGTMPDENKTAPKLSDAVELASQSLCVR